VHRGRNANVYRACRRGSCHPVVIKQYDARRIAARNNEVAVLRALAAGQQGDAAGLLLHIQGGVEESAALRSVVVLESCSGGTLIEAIANSGGRLSEQVAARRITAPLLRALAHLHTRGIVHRWVFGLVSGLEGGEGAHAACTGPPVQLSSPPPPHLNPDPTTLSPPPKPHSHHSRDLKPEHILLTPDGLRIADFSTAAWLPPHQRESDAAFELLNHRPLTIAAEYAAPELLSKPSGSEVFHKVSRLAEEMTLLALGLVMAPPLLCSLCFSPAQNTPDTHSITNNQTR